MRNSERFFEAFAHTEHRVMGRRLARFTLRHRFWLEAFESPLVTGGETGLMDLEMATRICTIPYAELERRVPRMIGRGPRWRDKAGYLFKALRRRPEREYGAFQAYLLDHGCPPAMHQDGVECGRPEGPPRHPLERRRKPVESGTLPGPLSLVTGLLRGGMTDPEKVWSLSPGEAEWYLTGVFLHRGVDVKIKTAQDEEFEEGIRREREAGSAKGEVPGDQ